MDIKLRDELIDFRNLRGWGKHHTGNHLAHALMIESAELNRLFLWGNNPVTDDENENLSDELADIAIYLEYILHHYSIDIDKAVRRKMRKNSIKYKI